jgi:hypothetical protein
MPKSSSSSKKLQTNSKPLAVNILNGFARKTIHHNHAYSSYCANAVNSSQSSTGRPFAAETPLKYPLLLAAVIDVFTKCQSAAAVAVSKMGRCFVCGALVLPFAPHAFATSPSRMFGALKHPASSPHLANSPLKNSGLWR